MVVVVAEKGELAVVFAFAAVGGGGWHAHGTQPALWHDSGHVIVLADSASTRIIAAVVRRCESEKQRAQFLSFYHDDDRRPPGDFEHYSRLLIARNCREVNDRSAKRLLRPLKISLRTETPSRRLLPLRTTSQPHPHLSQRPCSSLVALSRTPP